MTTTNDNLVLIGGKPASGKSACLRNLKNPEGVFYFNCEANKKPPFPAKFQQFTITDPHQVEEGFAVAETKPEIHTIVIDSLTYLMDMYESLYIHGNTTNGMKAWADYAQYFKRLMQEHVAKSSKNVIFIAHTLDQINDEMITETAVPIKGSLKNNGVESYFSCVLGTKKMAIKDLKGYENDLLKITEEEEMLGFKYVFQTKLTKKTVNERLRAPMGMWETKETYIDNDIDLVLNRLHEFYGE